MTQLTDEDLEAGRIKSLEDMYAKAIDRSTASAKRLATVAALLDDAATEIYGSDTSAKTVQPDTHESRTVRVAADANGSAYCEAKETVQQIADLSLLLASRQRAHAEALTGELEVLRANGYQP